MSTSELKELFYCSNDKFHETMILPKQNKTDMIDEKIAYSFIIWKSKSVGWFQWYFPEVFNQFKEGIQYLKKITDI